MTPSGRLGASGAAGPRALLAKRCPHPVFSLGHINRAAGRNNWLFVGSDRGGKTMAILLSFVDSRW